MSISSLVIDVDNGVSGRELLAALATDPRFTLGPADGTRHALVVDTPSSAADTEVYDWLQSHPGIRLVTLVRAYLDDEALPVGTAATYL